MLNKCLFFAFLLVPQAMAAPKKPAALSSSEIQDLQKRMGKNENLAADFVQTRKSALRPGHASVSSGRAEFSRPHFFHWTIAEPFSKTYIFDGEDYCIKGDSGKKSTRFKPQSSQTIELQQIIDSVLSFDALLQRFVIVNAEKSGKDQVQMTLKPKTSGDLAGILIVFNTKKNYVQKLTLSYENKGETSIEFLTPSFAKIPRKTFNCDPPL